jgi:hypothetical protein
MLPPEHPALPTFALVTFVAGAGFAYVETGAPGFSPAGILAVASFALFVVAFSLYVAGLLLREQI